MNATAHSSPSRSGTQLKQSPNLPSVCPLWAVLMLLVLNRLVFPKLRVWRDSL
jgi:hypothetical protein